MLSPIFKMFGRSPIRPLQKHMQKAYQCAKTLLTYIDAVYASDWDHAHEIRDEIADMEQAADDMKKDLRLHLPKGLFMPIPRTDLLEILTMQDRIANRAKDIAGIIYGRKMQFPESIKQPYQAFLQRCIDAAAQANKAIHELDELLETGFRGNEVTIVEDMIHELDSIEHDTDNMQIDIRQALYKIEKDIPAVDVMFLYKVIDWTGDLADRAENVGGQLLLLLAR